MKTFSFDTEDLGEGSSSVTMIGFYDGEIYHIVKSKDSAIDFLKKNGGRYYTFNLEYDIINLFWPDVDKIEFIRAGSRMITARFHDCYFYDLVWIGLLGMGKAAPLIGMKKGELNANDIAYLKNDLLITYEWYRKLEEYIKHHFDVKLKSTLAGIGLEVFKKNFGGKFVLPRKQDEQFIRDSYYGGRTEVFKIGKTMDCMYYDINSLYPFVMANYEYPTGEYTVSNQGKITSDLYIVDAEVDVPFDMFFPILPYRQDSKLLFPTGRLRGVWCSPEFDGAIERGVKVRKIYKVINFKTKNRPFYKFVSTLYDMRVTTKNEFEKFYLKIIMNSVYGKFATHSGMFKFSGFLDTLEKREISKTPYYANIYWSSFITSYARRELYLMIEKFEKGELIYCDTDSIIVTSDSSYKVENSVGTNLGELKLEDAIAYIEIKGLKYYYYINMEGKEVYKVRGVPMSSQEDFFLFGEVAYKKPMKMLEAIRTNGVPNLWDIVTKSACSDYTKRIVSSNGVTLPHKIGRSKKKCF